MHPPGNKDYENASDEELMEAILEGCNSAFETLVNRHAHAFYRVAYRVVLSMQDAEDIVQEAFLKLWQNPALWDKSKKTAFFTWFYRVVTNHAIDYVRKRKPNTDFENVTVEDERENAEEALIRHNKENQLSAAIASLPERQQVAITLCYLERYSNKEAAEKLGVSVKALESLLIRAKRTLRDVLDKKTMMDE